MPNPMRPDDHSRAVPPLTAPPSRPSPPGPPPGPPPDSPPVDPLTADRATAVRLPHWDLLPPAEFVRRPPRPAP